MQPGWSSRPWHSAMPLRYGLAVAEEGSGASLPDRIALGVLIRVVTRELVEDVLTETGRREHRRRLLPARATVYFTLALALFYAAAAS